MATDSKVETISRLAQWRVNNFGPCNYKRSNPFKVKIWNWHLLIKMNRYLYICLFSEPSRVSKEQPPIARFVLRVSNTSATRRLYISPTCDDIVLINEIKQKGQLQSLQHDSGGQLSNHSVVLLSIVPNVLSFTHGGGDATSIWSSDGTMQSLAEQTAHQCLSRMLYEAIHADVTINLSDGTRRAHKAILAASSPVFRSMFLHNLKEKESSIIDIEDMSQETFMTFLEFLYGITRQEDFWKHRLALLDAANKYDIANLKDSCEESLLEDLNSENVIERLRAAGFYQLEKLKKGCLTYLLDFGKIYDVKNEISDLPKELLLEMFQTLLATWKPT